MLHDEVLDVGNQSSPPSFFAILQVVDSSFPTGSFGHSGGLEAAWKAGAIHSIEAVGEWLNLSAQQSAFQSGPFVAAASRTAQYDNQLERLLALDRQMHATVTGDVARRASLLQGQALLRTCRETFKEKILIDLTDRWTGADDCGHLPIVFGTVVAFLGCSAEKAVELHLFCALRACVSAAVRLGIVGSLEGQALLVAHSRRIADLAVAAARTEPLDAVQVAPLLEIWQGGQDRLYSRLFQS